jgi:large subunit ribosomal protein L15
MQAIGMVVRRDKKNRKYRGRRNQGYGCHKKHRGSGSRGGSGNAGMHKFKWSYVTSYEPGHFGKRGFRSPKAIANAVKATNVGDIEALAAGKKKIDLTALGYRKVLGGGRIGKAIEVIAPMFSKKAAEKITAAGGKFEGVVASDKEEAKAGGKRAEKKIEDKSEDKGKTETEESEDEESEEEE